MEIKHASLEPFYRYIHCEGFCKRLSRHEVQFKNVFFNQVSGENDVCYTVSCLNCSLVFKSKFLKQTKTTTAQKWNDFVTKSITPTKT